MNKIMSIEEELEMIDWNDVKQRAKKGYDVLIMRTVKPTDTPELNKAIKDKLDVILKDA